MMILIAPVANTQLRTWPASHYSSLISRISSLYKDATVTLIGAPKQKQYLDLIKENSLVGGIENRAGQDSWLDTVDLIKKSNLVIGNNSGVTHLSAAYHVPTVCIFSATHDPMEWGPRGPLVRIIVNKLPCSPCGMDGSLTLCTFSHDCMQGINPEDVINVVKSLAHPSRLT